MPLVPANLQSDLQSISARPGATVADCAAAWATAVRTYAAAVVPQSTSSAAAGAALEASLASAFATPAAAQLMDAALATFAATLGAGMAPAFVAVPPPAPLGFATLFAEPYPPTAEAFAVKLSTAVDTWMRTGTATPSVGGSPVPWT